VTGRGRPPGPIPAHGTRVRYTHHGCRCPDCRTANTIAFRNYRDTGSTVRHSTADA